VWEEKRVERWEGDEKGREWDRRGEEERFKKGGGGKEGREFLPAHF